jgi:hypothetical protein
VTQRPDQISWLAVLRGWPEAARQARLIVPLRLPDTYRKKKDA